MERNGWVVDMVRVRSTSVSENDNASLMRSDFGLCCRGAEEDVTLFAHRRMRRMDTRAPEPQTIDMWRGVIESTMAKGSLLRVLRHNSQYTDILKTAHKSFIP